MMRMPLLQIGTLQLLVLHLAALLLYYFYLKGGSAAFLELPKSVG